MSKVQRRTHGHLHLAIDPGNTESGWLRFRLNPIEPGGVWVEEFGTMENGLLRAKLLEWHADAHLGCLCIEMMKARGMPTANEELEACVQIGRFLQVWPGQSWSYVFRGDVKLTICGQARAKDPNVRQALIDLWGGEARALGGKRCGRCHGKRVTGKKELPCQKCGATGWEVLRGPLYGMAGDAWAALGVAYTWAMGQRAIQVLPASNPSAPEEGDEANGNDAQGTVAGAQAQTEPVAAVRPTEAALPQN